MASWQEGLIQIHGKQAQVEKAREAIQSVDISKNKATVMGEIQNIIDDKKLKASIYYDGLRIYPFLSLKKEFEKMIKTDSIEKMTDAMYNLLYLSFDIAHYNKHGYIDYYGGKFSILWKETLSYEMHKLLEHPYPRRNDSLVSLSNFVVLCMDGGKEVVVTEKGIQEPSLASSSFFSEENVLFSLPTTTDIPMLPGSVKVDEPVPEVCETPLMVADKEEESKPVVLFRFPRESIKDSFLDDVGWNSFFCTVVEPTRKKRKKYCRV